MKREIFDYDVYPKVVLIKEPVEITIKPLGRHAVFEGEYRVEIMSLAHGLVKKYPWRNNLVVQNVSAQANGSIIVKCAFAEESEYLLHIVKDDKEIANINVYALNEDMRGRYPYRGDLHIHTNGSDGKQSPEVTVANYRKNGYDFMVISDHRRYYPSLNAIDAYKDVPIEMNIVYGEEIHLPDNDVHIVNFGGKYSVNGIWDESAQNQESDRRSVIDNPPPKLTLDQYKEEVEALIPELQIPEEIDQFTYACCVWVFNHIRKGEGLGIFCHPYWVARGIYQVPESLCEYMTKTHPFDAFEVLGGVRYFQQNGLQAIRYYEDRAKGINYPVVGSTDSHNSIAQLNEAALIASTFVFATENERGALIKAIKGEYCVAIDTISEEYRLVGDMRLVKYARFLLDEFTPLHDELCFEEGRLMKAYVTGDEDAAAGLKFINGRMKKMYEKYFRL